MSHIVPYNLNGFRSVIINGGEEFEKKVRKSQDATKRVINTLEEEVNFNAVSLWKDQSPGV